MNSRRKAGAPVCVLGTGAKASLFGSAGPVNQYVKLDEQWFRVIGVVAPQVTAQSDVAGVPAQDLNNYYLCSAEYIHVPAGKQL